LWETKLAHLTNRDIAEIFETIADILQIKGENLHRYLSYRRAGETIRDLPRDLRAIAADDGLEDIPNIGKTLAEKITEMLETGKLEFYERLKAEIPAGVVEIMRINGVGPKMAARFWQDLNITSLEELKAAAEEGKLANLKGMGKKSEQRILAGIEALARDTGRTPLGKALPAAQQILNLLMEQPGVVEGAVAGSLRRGRPTIGDIDLLIAVEDPAYVDPIMETFVNMENVDRVLGHGPTKSSVELLNGLQVDLRVLEKHKWGTALNYFTGSQAHNIRMRRLALEKRYSLNEHAFSPVDDNDNIIEDAEKVFCDNETDVYAMVGLPYIPPELREDAGEFEAAKAYSLPELITIHDIRADLHMHTTWSDGTHTIREMAEAARTRGLEYIAITDHSQYSSIANGLSAERLLQQQEEVRRVNAEMGDDFHVFHGVEMDIRADGTLDLSDEVMEKLDFVIASLHFSLQQDREKITQRALNALSNPHVDLLAHPRGQLIPDRPGADLDMDAVFAAALANDTALEINSNPHRLDLESQYARRAVEMGILVAIDTDAHHLDGMDVLSYGILTARRGWVTAATVINTWPVEQFMAWLQRRERMKPL
jgi:DNA polymerase (family 10)